MQKKKLQVFVSSTFIDLHEERQAAVEAILTAGHIPAGMELFAAGDQSQMETIRRWIEESDVFLLILGGRYGSIEPASKKSYVHLEYDHAIACGKPFFAVVIEADAVEQKVRTIGSKAMETENATPLREFRKLVVSRMVRFWRDPRDIKLSILETLADYSRREDLVGWTRSVAHVNVGALAEEMARLSKENTSLRSELARATQAQQLVTYQGLTFDEYYQLLLRIPVDLPDLLDALSRKTASVFGDHEPRLLHLAWVLSAKLRSGYSVKRQDPAYPLMDRLREFGILRTASSEIDGQRVYALTNMGNQFLLRLRIARDGVAADEYVLPHTDENVTLEENTA